MNFRFLLIFAIVLPLFLCQCKEDPQDLQEICNNGIDDDNDGFVDEEDNDCIEFGDECTNGLDDDGDGYVDADDFDCTETGIECFNGLDDDGDGFIDIDDFDCQ